MPTILAKDAEIGEIYVTPGGLAVNFVGEEFVWGYDRVQVFKKYVPDTIKLVPRKKEEESVVVRGDEICVDLITSWGVRIAVPADYRLCTTTETKLREADVSRLASRDHSKTIIIPFDEAIARGLEKMDDSGATITVNMKDVTLGLKERGHAVETSADGHSRVRVSNAEGTIPAPGKVTSTTVPADSTAKIIAILSEGEGAKITEITKTLELDYRKIRYILTKTLPKMGYKITNVSGVFKIVGK